ncbi:hypothetical protein [Microbacterium sp. P05]|uniref:hypothetical protein n=1 Tax=Microbacterium sp. P05 TaxID=3366948 RepID=UPI003746A76A
MSAVFYSAWLVRRGSLGWATHEAKFPNMSVLAHIQLSAFALHDGERFEQFGRHYALAYIETVNTPTPGWGGYRWPKPNKETDNHVWLETDHLTFRLQAEGVSTCSALGLIHDVGEAGSSGLRKMTDSVDFAIFDDDGVVVGTHRAVQLEGGERLDRDAIQEGVVERAAAESDRPVDITPVDLSRIPSAADFRIDLRTRRPIPPRSAAASDRQ